MTRTHPDSGTAPEVFSITIDGRQCTVPRRCPHRGGYLQYGEINLQRQTLTCPLHYSVFCLRTGAQLSGPPCGPLLVAEDPLSVGNNK
jgi:nitrite reductase/ring-hydroxylating ferredoxin subunit